MFSKNNKISKRQMFRLLMYDLLGIGTLLLPSALAKDAGRNGMLTIGIGIGAGLLYCMLLGFLIRFVREDESYPAFLKRCFGTFFGTVVFLFYALYYLCLGGYSAYIFGFVLVSYCFYYFGLLIHHEIALSNIFFSFLEMFWLSGA